MNNTDRTSLDNMDRTPTISLLIWTYNRADQVEKSINSVLAQTYQDFELILVNNGSTDHTAEVIEKYRSHPNVRLFHLNDNLGVIGGMNYALDKIRGEWFATLGDHDEILPHAFETLLKVVDEVDPNINAVTANAIASTTGEFCGLGLDKDQYLPLETIISKVSGDFFGITKTKLLEGRRLNENLMGNANAFWYKIDAVANRYYLHQGLKIFNTEDQNSVTASLKSNNLGVKSAMYRELINESFFWQATNKYNPNRYSALCLRGYFFSKILGHSEGLRFYRLGLKHSSLKYRLLSLLLTLTPKKFLDRVYWFISSTLPGRLLSQRLVKPFGEIKGHS